MRVNVGALADDKMPDFVPTEVIGIKFRIITDTLFNNNISAQVYWVRQEKSVQLTSIYNTSQKAAHRLIANRLAKENNKTSVFVMEGK